MSKSESKFKCSGDCGFTLDQLKATTTVKPTDGATLEFTCPLCCSPLELRLADAGVVTRGSGAQTQYVRWSAEGVTKRGHKVEVGEFQLRFDALGTIEPREICYPLVPAFRQETGEIEVPTLPVRPEYFDCVDTDRLDRMWQDGDRAAMVHGEYQVDLPLHGLKEPFPLQLQLMPHRPDGKQLQRVFSGVNLRMWPNLPIREWKHHLVGMCATGEGSEYLLAPMPRVRLFTRPEGGRWTAPQGCAQREGHAVVVATDERPQWIGLEIGAEGKPSSDEAPPAGGGLFYVPKPTQEAAGRVEMGLDFGTSNTCVAFKGEIFPGDSEHPRLLPEADELFWNHYLVRGGPEPRILEGPDLWPCTVGFGRSDDLFPSELLFGRTRVDQGRDLVNIDRWRYGIDFGMPPADVDLVFQEADYLLGDFKWAGMLQVTAPTFKTRISEIQGHYLAAVLMNTYARIAAKWAQHASMLTVTYAYPMSFKEDDRDTLEAAAEAAADILRLSTGLDWQLQPGQDEGTAAADCEGDTGAHVAVYLDMGGGSTDIAIKLEERTEKWTTVWANSVQYAGMTLLDAYCGEGEKRVTCCLAGNTTIDMLRRRVREASRVNDVYGDTTLFDKYKLEVTRNRTTHFYGYMVEYIARTLAAGFLDQRFKIAKTGGERRFPERLVVAVYLLGNGWRFDEWRYPDYQKALVEEMFKRMTELLLGEQGEYAEEIREQLADTGIVPLVKELKSSPHEKAAVAIGLLSKQAQLRTEATPRTAEAGILGWSTMVDGSREVPWFASYDRSGGNAPPPPNKPLGGSADTIDTIRISNKSPTPEADVGPQTPWYRDLSQPSLDWTRDSSPAFPIALESPFDLDRNLDHTRGLLRRECIKRGDHWFCKGPYEVMLESLFAPSLRKIGG